MTFKFLLSRGAMESVGAVLLLALAGLLGVGATMVAETSSSSVQRAHELMDHLLIARDALRDQRGEHSEPSLTARAVEHLEAAGRLAADPRLRQHVEQLSLTANGPRDQLVTELDAVIGDQQRLLSQRTRTTADHLRVARFIQGAGALLGLVLLAASLRRTAIEARRRIRSERQARINEGELAATLHSLLEGVIAVGLDGRITRLNPAASRLFESGDVGLSGRSFDEVCRVEVDGRQRSLLQTAESQSLVHAVLLRKSGRVRVEVGITALHEPDGRRQGTVFVIRDVSREEAARVAEENAQRQLVLSERMAALGLLAAGVAHEINNPLAYVVSNLEALVIDWRRTSVGIPTERLVTWEGLVADAVQGTTRIRKIVRSLKTLSRDESDRRVPIDPKQVVEQALDMTMHEIRHRARVTTRLASVPNVLGDEARLGQVIINLIINAAHALDPKRSDNEIRIETRTLPDRQAVIEVADTGSGITIDHLDRIFDPFFTTKPVGVGTGLGLSICHGIVSSMGGRIEVQSSPAGTAFTIILPSAESPAVIPKDTVQDERTQRLKILVIDDDPLVGRSVVRQLAPREVVLVESGARALETLDETFDAVLTDVMMPGMSGIEFQVQVARRFRFLADRVVFMTGGAFTPESKDFIERLPPERLLEKPIQRERLMQVLADLSLRASRQRGSS